MTRKSYTYKPLHPKIKGKCTVVSKVGTIQNNYYVDLDTGICSCLKGYPSIHTEEKGDIPNPYCSHKLKAIYSIYVREKDPKVKDELYYAFLKAVSTRYNIYEVCSAFHKDLRRGIVKDAWYWAQLLICMRGKSGLIRYMVNIIYEETRNHTLAKWLFELFKKGKDITVEDCFKAVTWFCDSKKKWELGRWRYHHFFFHEMLGGYFRLMKDFGDAVCRSDDIIPYNEQFFTELKKAFRSQNHEVIQYNLKGIQKMQHGAIGGLQQLRRKLYMCLLNCLDFLYTVDKEYIANKDAINELFDFIKHKGTVYELGYHDLNMLCDLLEGESLTYGCSECPPLGVMSRISPSILRLIPIYAQDNHTWEGKYRLKKFAGQLVPQVPQTDIDYRWNGAYLGVAFRYLSMEQLHRVGRWYEVSFTVKLEGKPYSANFFEYLYRMLY